MDNLAIARTPKEIADLLEINGQVDRLDLHDVHARLARGKRRRAQP